MSRARASRATLPKVAPPCYGLLREVVVGCFAQTGKWPETWTLIAGDLPPAPDVVADAKAARERVIAEMEAA